MVFLVKKQNFEYEKLVYKFIIILSNPPYPNIIPQYII